MFDPPVDCRVLVVDDCAISAEVINALLARKGVSCQQCCQPLRAIEVALSFRPTVILLDLVMPELDGLTLMDRFRDHGELAAVPIVILSAREASEEKAKAFTRGANDYLIKAPDAVELLARVRYHSRVYHTTCLLEQRNAELKEALDRAQDAAQAKSAFLANMSHEIRTPLNGILGLATLVLNTELEAAQREHLQQLLDSGSSLLCIINDILDTSKIESGRLDIESVKFELKQSLDRALVGPRLAAEEKGLSLELILDRELPHWVEGDPVRLRQVLLNLLSNAIKFTAEGSVRLQVRKWTQGIEFRVSDTGIGIAPDRLQAVFEPFTQADSSTTRLYGGTGLGLSIAAKLVNLMGGELKVTSVLDEGSIFAFSLPLEPVQAEPVEESEKITPITRPLRILVAEDNPVNQTVSTGFLELLGHQVTMAENGEVAVSLFRDGAFDLILMDLEMPVMDGFTAHGALREKWRHPVPVLALTAHASPVDRERCLADGMSGFVSKPFSLADLSTAIHQAVSGRNHQSAACPPHPRPNGKCGKSG